MQEFNSISDHLYIIGNGFDMHHGIQSGYSDFRNFVESRNEELFELLERLFTDKLWSDFEGTLAHLNTDEILEDASNELYSYGDEKWSDAYHHSYQESIKDVVSVATDQLRQEFLKWVLQLKIPTAGKLWLPSNALYFTFNYTPTLVSAYKISSKKILHIHGKAVNNSSDLILGHARKPAPKKPLNPDEIDDVRIIQGNEILDQYFVDTYKDTETIISENESYFQSLKDIKKVFILGHSLSEVDSKYFVKIVSHVRSDSEWFVTSRSRDQEIQRVNTLKSYGIFEEKIKCIRIENLNSYS